MKKEFKVRLLRLRKAIDEAIEHDSLYGNLLPYLFQAFTFVWCKNEFDLINHNLYKQSKKR